jgi:hypothetical protein
MDILFNYGGSPAGAAAMFVAGILIGFLINTRRRR